MLRRRMTKDEVRKLLRSPIKSTVSKSVESWDYPGGIVTFDGKGRVSFLERVVTPTSSATHPQNRRSELDACAEWTRLCVRIRTEQPLTA